MKQLACKPLFFACLLTIPLWIVLGNFIVAASVALLVAFFISMCYALYVMQHPKTTKLPSEQGKSRQDQDL